MNELQIFNYGDMPIRTIEKDGEMWLALKDVCKAIGLDRAVDAAKRLDSDEVDLIDLLDSRGALQKTYIINEPGLYNVILRSDKPEAKDFKRWVTHEVLPSIRQTGSYAMQQSQPMTPAQLIAAQAQLLVEMEQRVDAIQGQTLALEAKVDTAIKAFSRPAEDHWRADMDKAVKELLKDLGRGSITKLRGELYSELERTAGCDLAARLRRLRDRKKKAGMRCRDAMELGKLDAIAADKQLRAIFEGIVRSWQAKAVPAVEEVQG